MTAEPTNPPFPDPSAASSAHGSPVQPATPSPQPKPRAVLCPYCGHASRDARRCEACGGLLDPLSRQATQNALGPWFIRDEANPHRPGCSYETLKGLILKRRVTLHTVIRGPTTRQFWTYASRTPSVANLLGVCHNCSARVDPGAYSCGSCGAVFTPEVDRQHLGLGPVRLLPGQASPEVIAASTGPPGQIGSTIGDLMPAPPDRADPTASEPPAVRDEPVATRPDIDRLQQESESLRFRLAMVTVFAVVLAGVVLWVLVLPMLKGSEEPDEAAAVVGDRVKAAGPTVDELAAPSLAGVEAPRPTEAKPSEEGVGADSLEETVPDTSDQPVSPEPEGVVQPGGGDGDQGREGEQGMGREDGGIDGELAAVREALGEGTMDAALSALARIHHLMAEGLGQAEDLAGLKLAAEHEVARTLP